MGEHLIFDYYYGIEAEQYTFYRIPRMLMKDSRFKRLSCEAKLLYGLMLDRLSLSMKNDWIDEENRVFIHYKLEAICEDINCSSGKCVKILAELDSKKGIGLIERRKQGLGKPDVIYVKNFASIPAKQAAESENTEGNPRLTKNESLDLQDLKVKDSKNENSGLAENKTPAFHELEANKNKKNNTEGSYNKSIHLLGASSIPKAESDEMDGYRALVRENIDYDDYMIMLNESQRELFQELYEIICDVVSVRRVKMRINGTVYPYDVVKARFLKLKGEHLKYVIESMEGVTSDIRNIHSYLMTALYCSVETIEHHYKQRVQHDFYGSADG